MNVLVSNPHSQGLGAFKATSALASLILTGERHESIKIAQRDGHVTKPVLVLKPLHESLGHLGALKLLVLP